MSMRQACMKLIFLLSISLLVCSADPTSTLSNTLKQGDTLNFHQVMHSTNAEYALRFFKSGITDHGYYLGISYFSGVLWVANRETPILDDSGFLAIDNNGTLMITHSAGNPIVLYSDDGTGGADGTRVATLHDNGNLVFSELDSDGSVKKILWQSFRYPTDTLSAGMMLGVIEDQRATRSSLTSWLAIEDPSSGAFSLEWNPMQLQMVVRRRGITVWESGMLKDGIFQYIPQYFTKDCIPVVNRDGNSLSFSANDSVYWRLSEEGSLLFQSYNKTAEQSYFSSMEIMDMCYSYNNDNGCVKWLQPKCRSTDMPKFIFQKGFFRRVDSNEIDVGVHYRNASAGPGDCRAICWEDCDCVAYGIVADDIGCQFWKGKSQLTFHQDADAPNYLYVISRAAVSSHSPIHPSQRSTEGHVHGGNNKAKPGRK